MSEFQTNPFAVPSPVRGLFGSISRRRAAVVALAGLSAVALTACGSDAGAADGISDGVLTVELSDFSFGDLPDTVPAGTRLAVTSDSEAELHELVAVRLPDGEQRSAEQLVHDALDEVFAAAPPTAVLLAAPDGEQVSAVGDGTLAEPGRYLLLCAIPTGADPAEYLAAAATSDGPPQVAGGAPHFTHGMFAELTVT